MTDICSNCGKSKLLGTRKLCWQCTDRKRKYGTLSPAVAKTLDKVKHNKRECTWCKKLSKLVIPGEYTSTGKDMCLSCSKGAELVKVLIDDPVKRYLFKEQYGVVFPS
jgi:hypothetical protein